MIILVNKNLQNYFKNFVFSVFLVEMIKPFLLFKLTNTNQIFIFKVMSNLFNNKLYPFTLYLTIKLSLTSFICRQKDCILQISTKCLLNILDFPKTRDQMGNLAKFLMLSACITSMKKMISCQSAFNWSRMTEVICTPPIKTR